MEFKDKDNRFDDSIENTFEDDNSLPKLPIELSLKVPVKFGNKIIDVLVFQNPLTAKALKHLPIGGEGTALKMGHLFPVIRAMTGQPTTVIDDLSPKDLGECVKIVTPFMSLGADTEDI